MGLIQNFSVIPDPPAHATVAARDEFARASTEAGAEAGAVFKNTGRKLIPRGDQTSSTSAPDGWRRISHCQPCGGL